MHDFDFKRIAPRCGGQREAFEELCCQLAHRWVSQGARYTRLRGAGGDGGVECFADLPDGNRIGWQAKYVWDIDSLIAQADESLDKALTIHPAMTHYILCFPFDPTGPTGRRGQSGVEKLDQWRSKRESGAASEGRRLTIEPWPASRLRSLLLDLDTAGGMREFFFNETILSESWFSAHLDTAKTIAGPRYSPHLNVETDLWKWFAAFGRTTAWSQTLEEKARSCRKTYDRLKSAVCRTGSDPMSPKWPDDLKEAGQLVAAKMLKLVEECSSLPATHDSHAKSQLDARFDDVLQGLSFLESRLAEDLKRQHGAGADSAAFRQFMAEYQVSFPAANLDDVRDAKAAMRDLQDWLQSPAGSLAFNSAFVLTGAAGSGKTHGVCDAARQRLREGLLTCVLFGHSFRGEPDPWTRMLECLGLPITLGRDGLLDALNSAAEASGLPLIIIIDAINETRPLRYWRDHLPAAVQAVQRRPYLRLCVTCRTPFLPYCVPEGHDLPIVEHRGFAGVERDACKAFFSYFGLEPPIAPILQPELSNPLYLLLLCETLRARGSNRLPAGWFGLAPVIKAFLEEKERQFAVEHETSMSASVVRGSLRAIARAIADSGDSALSWSRAQEVVGRERPQAITLPVLEWLVQANLLLEDAPASEGPYGEEGTVRPAFERLGDFLIAEELLARVGPTEIHTACQPGGPLHFLAMDQETVVRNSGVVGALSILLPEHFPGLELPDLVEDPLVRTSLLRITVQSFPWRDPSTFSAASVLLVRESFKIREFWPDAMDAVLSVSWQPSAIDAIWLDGFLKEFPLARRDAAWCSFLHHRYDSGGPVKRLIDAAFELPLDHIEEEVAERWAVTLLWFTAAADRRVKEWATRAVTAIFAARPKVIPVVLGRMLACDDDEVRERLLLASYGALVISRDTDVVKTLTNDLHRAFRSDPFAFDSALIRDLVRCIAELASELGVLPQGCDPQFPMQPIGSKWPLELPSDDDIKRWEKLPRLAQSCLADDFFVYSLNSLKPWQHAVPKKDMARWILQRVAAGLGYEGSGCERYDRYILGKYGGGRGKPVWAERIGKKYQWIAMSQLASLLHDHVEPQRESWEPEPQRAPLILLQERKLDPTLPPYVTAGKRNSDVWWVGPPVDLQTGERLSDAEWVVRREDLPALEELLALRERDGQRWQLLVAYLSWDTRGANASWDDPYRQVWVHLQSYLVPREQLATAYRCLHGRNFFGRWMPEGPIYLYGFAGEYPWASAFNTEPEEWHGLGRCDLPFSCVPSWGSLAVEWEYDASLPHNFHMLVPARLFFTPQDLWWNGRDGYRLAHGRTIFRDPSVAEGGPSALVADADDLLPRLDKLGLSLLWILLGEKLGVSTGGDKPIPRCTYSQIAHLEQDGSVQVGKLVFFQDYDQDTGPRTAKGKRR